jgi:hypothetical protein
VRAHAIRDHGTVVGRACLPPLAGPFLCAKVFVRGDLCRPRWLFSSSGRDGFRRHGKPGPSTRLRPGRLTLPRRARVNPRLDLASPPAHNALGDPHLMWELAGGNPAIDGGRGEPGDRAHTGQSEKPLGDGSLEIVRGWLDITRATFLPGAGPGMIFQSRVAAEANSARCHPRGSTFRRVEICELGAGSVHDV